MLKFGRKKEKFYFVADIGSECLKTIFLKQQTEKTSVVSSSSRYLSGQDIFEAALRQLEEYVKNLDRKKLRCVLTLSPSLLRAKIMTQKLERQTAKKTIDKKEAEFLYQKAKILASKQVVEDFFQNSGVLPSDVQFTNLRILSQEVDGYSVPDLTGFSGKSLNFKILTVFALNRFLQRIESFFKKTRIADTMVLHEAEGFLQFVSDRPEGVFIDVGGEETGIFLTRYGRLEACDHFVVGSRSFSEAILDKLGVLEQDARILKERYAAKELTEEVSHRIEEIFSFPLANWFEKLELKLKEMTPSNLLPSKVYVFGGGAFLPDFKKKIQGGKWHNIVFAQKPDVKIMFPKDILGSSLQGEEEILNNPQYTPSVLAVNSQFGLPKYA